MASLLSVHSSLDHGKADIALCFFLLPVCLRPPAVCGSWESCREDVPAAAWSSECVYEGGDSGAKEGLRLQEAAGEPRPAAQLPRNIVGKQCTAAAARSQGVRAKGPGNSGCSCPSCQAHWGPLEFKKKNKFMPEKGLACALEGAHVALGVLSLFCGVSPRGLQQSLPQLSSTFLRC